MPCFYPYSLLFLLYKEEYSLIRRKRKVKKEAGFTLVELLIVLFIIGVLMSIVVPNIRAAGEKAQERACLANKKLIHVQMENYYLEHGDYPQDASNFLTVLYNEKYLDSIPSCSIEGVTYTFDEDSRQVICSYHDQQVDSTVSTQ